MKNFRITLIVLSVALFMSACKKSAKDILTGQKWKISSVTVAGTEQMPDCAKDDEYSFSADGIVTAVPMGVACAANETTQTSKYSISEDGKTMTYDYKMGASAITLNLTVNSLTEEKVDASGSMAGIPFQLVFVKK